MPSNQFLPFATGGGANTLTPSGWAALVSLLANGFQAGTASSAQVNTVLRQVSTVASALGQIINDQGGDALDNGSPAAFATALKAALGTLYAPLSSALTTAAFTGTNQLKATSGYQKLPGGLIIQWGRTGNYTGESGLIVTLPIAFPTACLSAVATTELSSAQNADSWAQVYAVTETSIGIYTQQGANANGYPMTARYMAIGY